MPFTRTGLEVKGSTAGRALLLLGVLYDVNVCTVNEHLKKICADSELRKTQLSENFG